MARVAAIGAAARTPWVFAMATAWSVTAIPPAAFSPCAEECPMIVAAAVARAVSSKRKVASLAGPPAGVAPAVGCGSPGKLSSGCEELAAATAACAHRRSDSGSRRLVAATPDRLPSTARIETWASLSLTFWWMRLAAKRVSEADPALTTTSASCAPAATAAASASSASRRACSTFALIGPPPHSGHGSGRARHRARRARPASARLCRSWGSPRRASALRSRSHRKSSRSAASCRCSWGS